MYNDFIKNNVTIEEMMTIQKHAEEIGYELAEHGMTIALFDSNKVNSIRYKTPSIIGVAAVSSHIYLKIADELKRKTDDLSKIDSLKYDRDLMYNLYLKKKQAIAV